jgi:pimeloyl-ACP methyl ester carboxylesterase
MFDTNARRRRPNRSHRAALLALLAFASAATAGTTIVTIVATSARAEAPRRWESVWPPGRFVNPVPQNAEIMQILAGHFESDQVDVQGPFSRQLKPFWYARAKSPTPSERVVIYLHGDVPFADRESASFYRAITTRRFAWFRKLAAASSTDVIMLVRPGYFMSPGDTLFRQAPPTIEVIAAAIGKLIDKYGYKSVAITGQSGGASIAAAMAMRDELRPQCLALASGLHYRALRNDGRQQRQTARRLSKSAEQAAEARWQEFDANSFDIGTNLDRVRPDPTRRIFVLGDPRDAIVPYSGQPKLIADLTNLGHHAVLIKSTAAGPKHHDLARDAVQVGLSCLNRAKDQEIIASVIADAAMTAKSNSRPALVPRGATD